MERMAAYLRAASPRKATVRETMRDRGLPTEASLGPRRGSTDNLGRTLLTPPSFRWDAGFSLRSPKSCSGWAPIAGKVLVEASASDSANEHRTRCGARPLRPVASGRSSLCARRDLAFWRFSALLQPAAACTLCRVRPLSKQQRTSATTPSGHRWKSAPGVAPTAGADHPISGLSRCHARLRPGVNRANRSCPAKRPPFGSPSNVGHLRVIRPCSRA